MRKMGWSECARNCQRDENKGLAGFWVTEKPEGLKYNRGIQRTTMNESFACTTCQNLKAGDPNQHKARPGASPVS